jgi:parvulin-like peptidyl-prolyl isomerase
MRNKIVFCLFICLFFSPAAHSNELFDEVIVTVGKQALTKKELELSYKQLERENLSRNLPLPTQRQKIQHLQNLIYELLFVTNALEKEITVSLKEINQAIEDFKVNNNFSEQEFSQLLTFLNIDYNYFQEQFRRKIFVEKLIQREIASKVRVNKKEIAEQYQRQYQKAETFYYLRHILKKSDTQSKKKELENIRKQAIQNNNFSELAKKHSEDSATANSGGSLAPLKKEDMIDSIASAVEKLKVGAISSAVKTPLGYHLFFLERIEKKSDAPSLEQVEEVISKELRAKKYQNNLQAYRQRLQTNYKVVIKDADLKKLLIEYADFEI